MLNIIKKKCPSDKVRFMKKILPLILFLFSLECFARVSLSFSLPTNQGKVEIEIHGKDKDKLMMEDVKEILEQKSRPIFDYFKYPPTTPIHFVIDNSYTMANGTAQTIPENIIRLYSHPPVGGSTLLTGEDFLEGLVLHELTHIIHMDQTRGLLKGVRSIFGSFGKWGGIVPKWFSEGIATWAETKFTEGGRLHDEKVRYMTDNFVMDLKNCDDVGCLDEPEHFPHGSIRYWLSSMFFDWLENKKPGAIECLVRDNSYHIPFFLNLSFRDCTGDSAHGAFEKFRAQYITEKAQTKEKNRFTYKGFKAVDLRDGGEIAFDRRSHAIGDKLLYIQHKDRQNYLKVYDSNTGKTETFGFPRGIAYFNDQSDYTRQEHKVLVSTHHLYAGKKHREIYSFNLKTKEWKRELDQRGDYPVQTSKNTFYYWRYKKHSWNLYQNINGKEKEFGGLTGSVQMDSPFYYKDQKGFEWVVYRAVRPLKKDKYALEAISLNRNEMEKRLYKSSKLFKVLDHYNERVILKFKDTARELNLTTGRFDKISHGDKLVFHREGDSFIAKNFKTDPQSFYFKKKKVEKKQKKVLKTTNFAAEKSPSQSDFESYPKLSHFVPNMWFINYLSTDSITYYEAFTLLQDPMGRHSLDIALRRYPDVDRSVVNGSYTFDSDIGAFSVGKFELYEATDFRTEDDETILAYASYTNDFKWGEFTYNLGLGFAREEVDDFISERKTNEVSLTQAWSRPGRFYHSFVQQFLLSWKITHHDNESNQDFLSNIVNLSQTLKTSKRFSLKLDMGYGRYDKDDYKSGVILSGGIPVIGIEPSFQMIGIDYQNAFGNEVTTAGIEIDYNMLRAFHGFGLLPLYFKDVNLISGVNYLKTDRIFKESEVLRNKTALSLYAGLRVDTTIFYYLPITLDYIFYSLGGDFEENYTGEEFLVRSSFSF